MQDSHYAEGWLRIILFAEILAHNKSALCRSAILYLSLTKCKSDTILLDGLTDPVAVQYIFLKVEIYNFIFAGFPCESKDVVTFLVQPQVSRLSLLQ